MKISKRTIIIAVIGLLCIIAAFASLYIEKEMEIKDLENLDAETETPMKVVRTKKVVPPEQPVKEQTNEATITDGIKKE